LKISRHRQLFSLFNTIVTGDDPDVVRGKPHPDIFEVAARRLGILSANNNINNNNNNENNNEKMKVEDEQQRRRCLVFEDAPAGVQAALAAKMPVCWVPDPRLDLQQLDRQPGVYVVPSLDRFDPEMFSLPQNTISF
jgi:pseudouridine-5'-monophosphatase